MYLVARIPARSPLLCLMVIATILGTHTAAPAHTWHVDGDNASGVEDGSAEHPYVLISSAMEQAAYGDTVLVMPGEYSEHLYADMHDPGGMNSASVVMRNGVSLVSCHGPDSTAIHGYSKEAVVYFDECDRNTLLDGFRIGSSGVGWGLRTAVMVYGGAPQVSGNLIDVYDPLVLTRAGSTPVLSHNTLGVNSPSMPPASIYLTEGSAGTIRGNTVYGIGILVSTTQGLSDSLRIEANNVVGTDPDEPAAGISVGPCDADLVRIIDNSVRDKATAIKVCGGTLRGNDLGGNTVALEARSDCAQREAVDAEMNWWGTADSLAIQVLIVDCSDDP